MVNSYASFRSALKKALARSGLLLAVLSTAAIVARAQTTPTANRAPVMTGRYHFLAAQDELAILQEETMLKGFIDVVQGPNESQDFLSYPITIGSRHGNQVSFRTRTIHEKYYRFAGTIERGKGKKIGDPDYLQLTGVLETITSDSVTGQHQVIRQSVVFKSYGRNEPVLE
jgi:hypothetical protein